MLARGTELGNEQECTGKMLGLIPPEHNQQNG